MINRAAIGECESPHPNTVYPELVEGLPFLQAAVRKARSKEQSLALRALFESDKLRIGGFGSDFKQGALSVQQLEQRA